MKKSYPYLDIVKLIMSFFVISIHTLTYDTSNLAGKVLFYIVNCAVPFYFIVSGFLLFQGIDTTSKENVEFKILKSIKRTAKLYFTWTIIYLPFSIHFSNFNDEPLKSTIYLIRGIFLVGQNAYSWPLWYLLSTLYALLFIYVAIHFFKGKKFSIYISAFISLILLQSFNTLLTLETSNSVIIIMQKLILVTIGNGRIFTGLFYIVVGIMIAEYQPKIRPFLLRKEGEILLFSISIFSVVMYAFSNYESCTFFLPITVVPIVILCLKPFTTRNTIFVKMRKCSTINYLTHMIWFVLYTDLILKDVGYKSMKSFIVTSCITLLVAFIFLMVDHKGKISKILL